MAQLPHGVPPHSPLPRPLVLLVGFIALVEVVLSLADAGVIGDPALRTRAFQSGAFWADLLRGGTPLYPAQPAAMFVTHALLHGGLLHMAMNMTILLALGRLTADQYGPGTILPVFLAGAVAGGAVFGLIADGAYPMVGASGAVFAFLGVWTVWDWYRHRAHGASVSPVLTRVAVLAGLNVVLYAGLDGMLAWEAHLGGFVAGLGCGVWLEGRRAAVAREVRAQARRRREAGND
jgi:rhomboid protease GluP